MEDLASRGLVHGRHASPVSLEVNQLWAGSNRRLKSLQLFEEFAGVCDQKATMRG
jgi:hypothetical protein